MVRPLMRWPLVTRRRYDEIVHQLAAEIRESERRDQQHAALMATMATRELLDCVVAQREELRDRLTREVGRVDVLTKFLMRMKAQGAVLLPEGAVQATRVAGQRRPLTPIEQAIDDNARARANPALRRRLNNFAEAEQRKGTAEGAIVERLRTWGDVTHDDDDEGGEPAFS